MWNVVLVPKEQLQCVRSWFEGDLRLGLARPKVQMICVPAVQEHIAGSDKSSAPAERGWADRIRVPCLPLRDERDLAGRQAD